MKSKTVKVFNRTSTKERFHGEVNLLLPKQWNDITVDRAIRLLGDSRFEVDISELESYMKNRNQMGMIDSFTLASPWSLSDGYGRVGTLTLFALQKAGYNIRPVQIGWRNEHSFTDEIRRAVSDNLLITKWGVVHGVPTELGNVATPRKILWTMWEGVTLPGGWAPLIKQYDNLPVIVPSSAMIDIFRRSGLDNKMYVLPDCIDPNHFSYHTRTPKQEKFTVVSWSHMTARKCPIEMVDVFMDALGSKPNVQIILKTAGGKFGLSNGMIPEYKDKRVKIYNELWSTEQLQSFLNEASAGLFLSHGEGFFLEPLEASLTGLPCVVPSHSGCADWAKEEYFYPVRTDKEEPAESMGANQQWWTMDYKHAAERLREIYDNYPRALEKANKALYWAKKNLSPEKTSNELVRLIDRIDRESK